MVVQHGNDVNVNATFSKCICRDAKGALRSSRPEMCDDKGDAVRSRA